MGASWTGDGKANSPQPRNGRGPPRILGRDEDGVTPIIGTLLVLAITVAGIGVTLAIGAPIIVRLQEQVALESVTAQLEEVRADANRLSAAGGSHATGINLPGGAVNVRQGTKFLVSIASDPSYRNCDLRLMSWHDGDAVLQFTYTGFPTLGSGCRMPAKEGPIPATTIPNPLGGPPIVVSDPDTCNHPNFGCFEAYRLPNLSLDLAAVVPVDCVPLALHTLAGAPCNTGVITVLGALIGAGDEFLFRLTDGAGTVYWQAWLLDTQRLEWSSGNVRAMYEAGAMFSQARRSTLLLGEPAVQENGTGGLHLSLPTWSESGGAMTGNGLHAFRITFGQGQVLGALPNATSVRLAFHGDLAQSWCNALLRRNLDIAGSPYNVSADIRSLLIPATAWDTGHQCDASSPNPDGVRAVTYDARTSPTDTFPVTFTRQVLHADLDP